MGVEVEEDAGRLALDSQHAGGRRSLRRFEDAHAGAIVVEMVEGFVQAAVGSARPPRVGQHGRQQPAGQARDFEAEVRRERSQAADRAAGNGQQRVEEAVPGAQVEAASGQHVLVAQGIIGRQGILPVNVVSNNVVEHGAFLTKPGQMKWVLGQCRAEK